MLDFTLNPDTGPPRLVRFISQMSMPSDDTIATLDAKNNVLLVCDELYQQLSHDDRGRILTTRHAVVDVERILQAA